MYSGSTSKDQSKSNIDPLRLNFAKDVEPPFEGIINRQTKGKALKCQEYKIEFKVKYETVPGQKLYVMGSIEELGSWEQFKCCMTWTEGHYWITKDLRIKSASYFQYKYALINDKDSEVVWE